MPGDRTDMYNTPQETRLMKRAYWLVRLRWLAVAGVIVIAFFASNVLDISVHAGPIYVIALVLGLYNAAILLLLNRFRDKKDGTLLRSVKRVVNLQMVVDLFLLTALLHLSGGVENPFVFFFVFHMVIASILLSVCQSYLHATYSILLFGVLLLFEYKQIIPHHCLKGFVSHDLSGEGLYLLGNFFAFATTLYIVVYMTSSIVVQLKEQERAYWEANLELERKDRLKDEYVARVTHDIKGHLAAIHSCLEVVSKNLVGSLNARQSEFIGRAYRRTRTLSTFVRTLLRLTQLRLSGKLEEEVFSLNEAVENAISSVRPGAEAKSLNLKCSIEPSEAKISGSRFSVEEMIANILLNAVKYTPNAGDIEVVLKEHGESVLVQISDTGIGIPKEDQPHIFDEFYRAGNAKELVRDGTGLGLSIVKQIIDRHRGRVWVESELGRGTTFKFTLPKAE